MQFNIYVLLPTKGGLCRRYVDTVDARTEKAALDKAERAFSPNNIKREDIIVRETRTDNWWRPLK